MGKVDGNISIRVGTWRNCVVQLRTEVVQEEDNLENNQLFIKFIFCELFI